MSCPYYWWNNHYACRKSQKDVDDDIYYKYCKNYDYSDCPIYKQELPTDSGCFLTTACIKARNLPDDCYELNIMRKYRDSYLITLPTGKEDIMHYYEIAPLIVNRIEAREDSVLIFCKLYDELVLPCVRLLENNDLYGAYMLYKEKTLELEAEYLD